jgi:hypothetical protein
MTVEAPSVSGEAGCWSVNKPNLTGAKSHRSMVEVDISVASIQYSSAGSRRRSDVSCLWVVVVMQNKLLLVHTRFMDLLPRSKRQ